MPNGLMEITGMSEISKNISDKVFGSTNSFYQGNFEKIYGARDSFVTQESSPIGATYGTLIEKPLIFIPLKSQEIDITEMFKSSDWLSKTMEKEEIPYRKSKSIEEQRNYQTNKPYDLLTEEDFARHAAFLRATQSLAERQIDLEPDFMRILNETTKKLGRKKPIRKRF